MSVELGLAAIATVDLAIKYGKELVNLYSSFRNASTEISEKVVLIEATWMRIQSQIDLLNRIWTTLDIAHQEQHTQTLGVLVTKLRAAITQISRVLRRGQGKDDGEVQIQRWKYTMIKDGIDKTIDELETWRRIFDPSWFLIIRMADGLIDRELAVEAGEKTEGSMKTARVVRASLKNQKGDTDVKTSIFLPDDGLKTARREMIPFCTAQLMTRSEKSNKYYTVDPVECLPGVNPRAFKEDVRNLARKLSGTDPMTFGLLRCKGVLEQRQSVGGIRFELVFYIPPELKNPRSLRSILLSPDPDISLSNRFRIAQQLAQSVSYVHTCNFVHKCIRPDTILIFASGNDTIAASFLLGFQNFRTAVRGSARVGDYHWMDNMYRHPRRQGLKPEDIYTMQHDIYSLGICLLEIGLWESLIMLSGGEDNPHLSPLLREDVKINADGILANPTNCKQRLVDLAKQKLPSRMGDKYTEVVVNCLTCLDEDNLDFGDQTEFEDDDGILVGVRFIEKILFQLNNISI